MESGIYSDINSPSNLHEFESAMAQKGSVDQRFDDLELEVFDEISCFKWVIWDLQAYLDALIIGNQFQTKTGTKSDLLILRMECTGDLSYYIWIYI